MRYTNAKQTDMILVYSECQKNAVHAQAHYARKFLNRQLPSRHTFEHLFNMLKETINFTHEKLKRKKRATKQQKLQRLLPLILT